MLLKKIKPLGSLDFKNGRFINIEACALAYIFAAILVVFVYDPIRVDDSSPADAFRFDEWIKQMKQVIKRSNGFYFD